MRSTHQLFRRKAWLCAAIAAAFAVAPLATAGAADLPGVYYPERPLPHLVYSLCDVPTGPVILFDRYGRPTVPARTPMFYCLTGHTLVPGQVPPPPEYCCR